MVVVHLLVDARDAGGMNAVNTMCEALAPPIAKIAGGRVVLRIISNLAIYRLARASATFPAELLRTETATEAEVVVAILDAYTLAVVDPFRCVTYNKGIMNGISAVIHRDRQLLPCGREWRPHVCGVSSSPRRDRPTADHV